MAGVTSLVVVTEDGHHIPLTGTLEHSINGVADRLKTQARRGYAARLTGDGRGGGTLELVQPVNDPTLSFEEVQAAFANRLKSSASSNFMFRGIGRNRGTIRS